MHDVLSSTTASGSTQNLRGMEVIDTVDINEATCRRISHGNQGPQVTSNFCAHSPNFGPSGLPPPPAKPKNTTESGTVGLNEGEDGQDKPHFMHKLGQAQLQDCERASCKFNSKLLGLHQALWKMASWLRSRPRHV